MRLERSLTVRLDRGFITVPGTFTFFWLMRFTEPESWREKGVGNLCFRPARHAPGADPRLFLDISLMGSPKVQAHVTASSPKTRVA
jgi:hypothetical protein